MAAFKRMLQVGIKVDNCLMRYRASKARSTSSSSSLKEFSKKKMDLHPEHEAGISLDEFECRMEKLCKEMDSDVAEFVALMKKSKRETKDFYESQFVATDKYLRKLAIGTVVCVNGAFIVAAYTRQSVKEDHGPSP